MGLFDRFRRSEWRLLREAPPGIQQDVAYLVALDALIKGAVGSVILKAFGGESGRSGVFVTSRMALSFQSLAREVHLAMLSTAIGKSFSSIEWTFLPSERAVGFLGILAMCEFRNAEELTVRNDLKNSGYSVDPDEARAQILVLAANEAGTEELDQVKEFDRDVFRDVWVALRRTILVDVPRICTSEPRGLSPLNEERYAKLSVQRKEILLILARTLSKREPAEQPRHEVSKAVPKVEPAPFNLELHQKNHPFMYVPYTRLIEATDGLASRVARFYQGMEIDAYEVRRLTGAKSDLPADVQASLVGLDADAAAYCIVVASVLLREAEFALCGVSKKLTEAVEKRNVKRVALVAGAMSRGIIGDDLGRTADDDKREVTLMLDLVREIRGAASKYIKSSGTDQTRFGILLGGTTILRHVINHPRYGSLLEKFIQESFSSIDLILEELKRGKPLTWKEQQKL